MKKKLELPNITLIAATSVEIDQHQIALKISSRNIQFGAVKLLSSSPPNKKYPDIENVPIPKMNMSGDDLIVPVDISENIEGNNENTTGIISTNHFDLPLLLRVGISGTKLITNIGGLLWAIDSGHPNDNNSFINTGLELNLLKNLLSLRTGYRSLYLNDRVSEYSFGVGLNLNNIIKRPIHIDYSFESLKFLGTAQQIGLRIKL